MQEALGDVDNPRDVVAIPQPAWDAALATTRFVVSALVAEVPEVVGVAAVPAVAGVSAEVPEVLAAPAPAKSTAL